MAGRRSAWIDLVDDQREWLEERAAIPESEVGMPRLNAEAWCVRSTNGPTVTLHIHDRHLVACAQELRVQPLRHRTSPCPGARKHRRHLWGACRHGEWPAHAFALPLTRHWSGVDSDLNRSSGS